MKKWLKQILLLIVILVLMIAIATYFYLQQPKFGELPKDERLVKITQSSLF